MWTNPTAQTGPPRISCPGPCLAIEYLQWQRIHNFFRQLVCPHSKISVSWCSVFVHCLLYCHRSPLKKICLSFLYTLLSSICIHQLDPCLFQAKQSWLSQPSLTGRYFIILVALCLIPLCPCLSGTGKPCTRQALNKGEGSPFLDLLGTLLMPPRILLAFFASRTCCWLLFNLLYTRIPRSVSAKLLSSQVAPAHSGARGCSSPLCIFPCWTSWVSYQPMKTISTSCPYFG